MPGCSLCMGNQARVAEYMACAKQIGSRSADIYRYLNADRIGEYTGQASKRDVARLA